MEKKVEHESLLLGRSRLHNIVQIFSMILDKGQEKQKNEKKKHADDKGDHAQLSMLPSDYMKEMLMTTEERIESLMKLRKKITFSSDSEFEGTCSFISIPSVIIFQQFIPGNVYNIALSIRNVSKISHYIKLSCEVDPSFTVEFRGATLNTRIAPGMALVYNVKFSPEEKKDYHYQAIFVTDTEIFKVPIIAIGPRPLLDFPDRIELPMTAVKIPSSKSILVRNIGDVPAIFTLYTESPHFSIEPSKGIIEEEETVQFALTFLSVKAGDFEGTLLLKYESGETIRLELRGSAINSNVRLDRGSIRMEDTFLGLTRSKTFSIHNRSDYIVRFQWMQYKDKKTDENRKKEYKQMFGTVKDIEVARCADLVHFNVCLPKTHELICQRIYTDEIAALESDTFPFHHTSFIISPMEGEIWPQSSIESNLLFKPNKVGEISSTAYLEVAAREDRIPLSFIGVCKGPVFHLNAVTINIGNVFLCSVHNYEVICANKGFIPGVLAYQPRPSNFGSTINIEPPQQRLEPGEYKSFNLSFSSNRSGSFVERIDFVVKESLEMISMHVEGKVICPTLHFDKESLDFGVTPLGFTSKHEMSLHNLSLVPVTFSMSVSGDGDQLAVTHDDFSKALIKPNFPSQPCEFVITPCEGVVAAHSFLKVKISYTPNIVRHGQTNVRVDMWDSDVEPMVLPITYRCKVANLIVTPSEVAIRFCFINHPYTRTLTIENKSDVEGYFYLAPQVVTPNSTILYSVSTCQGYLKPGQSKSISLTIITSGMGKQSTSINLLTFGEKVPNLRCTLICNGQGPVVAANPILLNWHEIPVLQEEGSKVTLINDSPIPAEFKINLGKRNSPWSVHPIGGEIEANQSVELDIKVFLRDAGKYSDKILVSITNSRTIFVNLTATAVGSSIIIQPPVFPVFEMGLLFCNQNISLPITMENKSTKNHQLIWVASPELRLLSKGRIQSPTDNKFRVEPVMIDLPAGETRVVHCKIRWDEKKTLSEQWYLHAQIEGLGKREILGISNFTATFVEPSITFSKTELFFRLDMFPDCDKLQITDELYVMNESKLNLNTHLSIDPPFELITDNEEYVYKMNIILIDRVRTRIRARFSLSNYSSNKNVPQTYQGVLKLEYNQHSNKDKIWCKAEINYPHIELIPDEIKFSCDLGCSAEKKLVLMNSGPIPVFYHFLWCKDSIKIEHRSSSKLGVSSREINEDMEAPIGLTKDTDVKGQCIESAPESICFHLGTSIKSPNTQRREIQSDDDLKSEKGITISKTEIRDFLLPLVHTYLAEDTELPALDSISNEPPFVDYINKVLDIVPREGRIAPYTSQCVSFAFYGLQPVKINVKAICQVRRGQTQVVNISATAGVILYNIDKSVIDFGQHIFCDHFHSTLKLENQGLLRFAFRVNNRKEMSSYLMPRHSAENLLKISPRYGIIEPKSSIELEIYYRPIIPGPFKGKFYLEIGYLQPITMHVQGVATFPQVYICIPRVDPFQEYPVEYGYEAIASMQNYTQDDNVQQVQQEKCSIEDLQMSLTEMSHLKNDGWVVISSKDGFPNVIDIDMSVERHFSINFIKENMQILLKHNIHNNGALPYLFSTEYIIDMGYVIVGQVAHYSAMLYNYGSKKTSISLKKAEKNSRLNKSGITIQFRDVLQLPAEESAPLQITFYPTRSKYPNKNTIVNEKIYFEVTHGCTLPVAITAIVTYPFLTVNSTILDFGDVLVGECLLMPLLFKNEGSVDCQWELKFLPSRRKCDDNPFHVNCTSGNYPPGQQGVINIYFKPRRAAYVEAKLTVTVHLLLERQIITFVGRGIEHKLSIVESTILFPPTIPYTKARDRTFTIENIGQLPVEFYWHHLDDTLFEEDCMARILTHYYQVDEILLPTRKLGERLPEPLLRFFKDLLNEIILARSAQLVEEKMMNEVEDMVESEEFEPRISEAAEVASIASRKDQKDRKGISRKQTRKRKSTYQSIAGTFKRDHSLMKVSIQDGNFEEPHLPINDPKEIERMMHCYIDDLQKMPDFFLTMKDPVAEVFNAEKPKAILEIEDDSVPRKKCCVIFHGAPYTEYQEAACKTARILNVPLLDLNAAVIEVIALGNSICAEKMRNIIDTNYQSCLTKTEAYMESLANQSKIKENLSDRPQTPKSGKLESTGSEKNVKTVEIKLHEDPDPVKEFKKIPSIDELNDMDSLSRYEYIIEGISLMQKMMSRLASNPPKQKSKEKGGKSPRNLDGTFNLSLDLVSEAVEERLSMPDFKAGFVLQTLNNKFVKSEPDTLSMILKIIGNVEYFMFISFYNDMEMYNARNDELIRQKLDKARKVLLEKQEAMEEMSQSEFENLPEEDKEIYARTILMAKKQAALIRKTEYQQKLFDARRKKVALTTSIKKKPLKGTKSKILRTASPEKSVEAKTTSGRKTTADKKRGSKESAKRGKEIVPAEFLQIVSAMDDYHASLNTINSILHGWDPVKKILHETPTGKSKSTKGAKDKDKHPTNLLQEDERNKFYIWYVMPRDPWDNKMIDAVITQMAKNDLAKKALPSETIVTLDLEPKAYSVLTPKSVRPSELLTTDVYDIMSMRLQEEESTSKSAEMSISSIPESQKETMSSQSGNFVTKVTDYSSTDVTNTFVSNLMLEEALKPRWILQPNEVQLFKMRFSPKKVGVYQQEFAVTIIDSPDTTYRLKVHGISDIPRIIMDPALVFPKVEDTKIDESNDPTYFLDTGIFDFGSLLIQRKEYKKIHLRETQCTFFNNSTMTAVVSFSLQHENSDHRAFESQPTELRIPPDMSGDIQIWGGASKLGPNLGRLLICIKNNPKVEIIELRSYGTKVDVELEGKEIEFDKILLYRKETRNLVLRNKSAIPVFWRIYSENPMDTQITCSEMNGQLKPWSESTIDFTYNAKVVGTIEKITMIFLVLLQEEDTEPLFMDTITISGETYDVAVDVDSANPINLKCVKVGSTTSETFTVKNRGLYEVKFIIRLEKDEKIAKIHPNLPENLKEDFTIRPVAGSVLPQKSCQVHVIFTPRHEMTLTEAPLLKCHLLDTNKDIAAIAEFPLTVSLVSYYTRFRLLPFPLLDFGTVGLCTKKTMCLNIENVGKFPFKYMILSNRSDTPVSQLKHSRKKTEKKDGTAPKTDRKSPRTEKTTAKSSDDMVLKMGPFTFSKSGGEIEVGTTETVTIDCYAEISGLLEEEIRVLVPDSVPQDRNGKNIILKVNSCLPKLEFEDLDTMFQESHIVDDIQDFHCPKEATGHVVLARQENCLYFRNVCVLKTQTTCFKLHNPGVVLVDVEAKIRYENPLTKDSFFRVFTVEPTRECIPPMSSKSFAISFKPSIIQTYTAVLEVTLDLPLSLRSDGLSIKLVGESCVPEITLIEPCLPSRSGRATINFGRTLLDDTGHKSLCFENVGTLETKVIVEISDDPNYLFYFEPHAESKHLLCMWDYHDGEESNDRCTVCRLTPGDVASFDIIFQPSDVGKCEGQIRLAIVDNPYENIIIDLDGECYLETIIFQGLQLAEKDKVSRKDSTLESGQKMRKLSAKNIKTGTPSRRTSAILAGVVLAYKLDYGTCFLNKMKRISFKIINKSDYQYFRFEWSSHPNVVFVPSIGHLEHKGTKEIVATFLASEPMILTQVMLDCVINEITLSGSVDQMFWDDRQTSVQWIKSNSGSFSQGSSEHVLSKKVVEPSDEPEHTLIPGTTRIIQLQLFAVAAYSEYSCSEKEIRFDDTLMLQSQSRSFKLNNPGTVELRYSWNLSMDEQYPKRLSDPAMKSFLNSRSSEDLTSRPSSRSSKGVLYPLDHNCQEDGFYATRNICDNNTHSHKVTDLFSSTAARTNRSTDTWLESDQLPFHIEPENGVILPGGSIECILTFYPVDVFEYKAYLDCKIENLNPDLDSPEITITGRSLLPYCHFDLSESNYLTSGRRDPAMPGPRIAEEDEDVLPSTTRVLEFNVIGIGEHHVKKFNLINPTAEDYRFSWIDITRNNRSEVSYFHCVFPEGIAKRGKYTEQEFTFLADDVGTFESFWLFAVDKYQLETLFLLVGIVKEPSVCVLTTHLKMKPTTLGVKTYEDMILCNNEEFPLPFNIIPDSLFSQGRYQCLKIEPKSGVLEPNSKCTLRVEFVPTLPGEWEFPVKCRVKKMKNFLTVLITTTTYKLVPVITYVNTKEKSTMIQHDRDNVIDFGKLMIEVPVSYKFIIENSGEISFRYFWDLRETLEGMDKNVYTIFVSEMEDEVHVKSQSVCHLVLNVFQKTVIKNHLITIKIDRGPTYRLLLKATTKRSFFDLSFDHFDFGPRYIQKDNVAPYRVELQLTNSEKLPCIVECKLEDVPHFSVELDRLSQAVGSKSSIIFPIIFRPLELKRYTETLTFVINSSIEKSITVTGEGILYKIHLANSRDKSIDFGNIPVGKSVTRKIAVINSGRAPVKLMFNLLNNLPRYDFYEEKNQPCSALMSTNEKSKKSNGEDLPNKMKSLTKEVELVEKSSILPLSEFLTISPLDSALLYPNKQIEITLKFSPKKRMKPFIEKFAVQLDSTIMPLSIIRGSCIGAEFQLNRNYLSFGVVVEGCACETKLMLLNPGDVGARFKWNVSKLQPHFSLTPLTGYCSPGMDITFIVIFKPAHQGTILEGEATIEVEKYRNFGVKMTGSCSKLPEPVDKITLVVPVRKQITKQISISNDSVRTWEVEVVITGDYFSGENIIEIPAKKTSLYAVTYAPLVMNNESDPHKGSILFKLPEGKTPILFTLIGISQQPEPNDKINRQIPATTKYTELMPVYNWLNRQQQFDCKIESLNELKDQPIYTFTGNNRLDVPAKAHRDYRASFLCYKEANFHFKVTFTNSEGEYQYYDVQYKVTKPEILESIKLTTTIRTPVCHLLHLSNPLTERSVSYTANCRNDDITIHGVPKILPPMSNDRIKIEFFPLIPSEEITKLDIHSPELGNFPYELRLKANAAPAEKATHVKAFLGSSTNFYIPIKNHSKKIADFTVKLEDPSFTCDKMISIPAFKESHLAIIYEPCDIENVTTVITVASDTAGEFLLPIIGTYILPKPQGPFIIKFDESCSIPFKNVFKDTKTFNFVVDDPQVFVLKTTAETIDSKKSVNIIVNLYSNESSNEEISFATKYPVTGKLIVCCTDPFLAHVNWTYYLREDIN